MKRGYRTCELCTEGNHDEIEKDSDGNVIDPHER